MASINTTKDSWQQDVESSNKLVIVDFWAVWCGPCKILSPILEEIGEEQADKVSIVKVNVDEEQDLQQKYNIMSIPTMKFFKNGQEVAQIIGAASKAVIEEEIAKHI